MTYKVNLIPPNLRKNETIIQIADSLDHLSRVVDDIMLNIERRVDLYSNKLNDVSERVGKVETKISQLKGVKNAIQVFSSSKYPASDTDRAYVSIFPTKVDIPMVRHEVSQKYPLKKDEPIDKLHIYHVKLSKLEQEKLEGLGQIPNDINCISDLILYNSGRNPYNEFSKSSSLKSVNPSVKKENSKIQIGTAPASIAERSFSNLPNQEYFYSPDLGDVPSLDVPLDLPDLPGIAGNVRYEEDTNFVIAPSVAFPREVNPVDQETFSDKLDDLPEIISPSPPPSEDIPEAPKPIGKDEPKEEIRQPKNIDLEETANNVMTSSTQEIVKPEKIASKLPAVPDARASLMEAIREAGGAKVLKSTDKSSSAQSEAPTGDLMADLHAKLAMRRKGISGAKQNTQNVELNSRGALNLMSALIPPPEETNEETDQEEDWE